MVLAAGLTAGGQDPAATDKVPVPPDAVPSAFRMFLVTDARFKPLENPDGTPLKDKNGNDVPNPKNRPNKIHCLVCEYGLNPVVAVFVRPDAKDLGPESGVAKLATRLNALVPKYRSDKLSGFVAFLNLDFKDEGGGPTDPTKRVTVKKKLPDGTEVEEKVEQDKEYPDDERRVERVESVGNLARALGGVSGVPFGLAGYKSKALAAWGVGDDEVTVIVYNRMRRVGEPWRFPKADGLTDEKIDEILKAAVASFVNRK
ncbi:MAG: hypothetical protein C0501_04075 [Isosphaera sp.]|nr:hypothetical protein [Isosphaera sp.]